MDVKIAIRPSHFDLLLSDLKAHHLHEDIARQLNVQYLGIADQVPIVPHLNGVVWGPAKRFVASAIVSYEDQHRTVIFVVDTGSPYTYICGEGLKSLGIDSLLPEESVMMHFNGSAASVWKSPPESHFSDINILGTDFLHSHRANLKVDYGKHVGVIDILFN